MVYVNYHDERKALASVVAPQPRRATKYVTGGEEVGKTELLQWFRETHGSANLVCYIDIDDRHETTTPRVAMSTFVTELDPRRFEKYRALDQEIAAGAAIVKDVNIEGSYNHVEASKGVKIGDQLANLIPLTQAFVEGLADQAVPERPIVLCVDGYSSTDKLTRLWVAQHLVRLLRPRPNVYLVLAGRDPPDRELRMEDRSLQVIELRGIHDVEEWLAAARELECELAVESDKEAEVALRAVINYAQGRPGGIMAWLRTMTRRGA